MLEAYVLADTPADRKKLKDSLIPGSETQLYLQILDTLKSIQEDPSAVIPDNLHAEIENYARRFSNGQ